MALDPKANKKLQQRLASKDNDSDAGQSLSGDRPDSPDAKRPDPAASSSEDKQDSPDEASSQALRLSDKERMASKPLPNEEAYVCSWLAKIKHGKDRMQKDFDRMKENQRFARGIQWAGQKELDFEKYVCNLVLNAINKGVAALYARDPKVDFHRRERLDYAIWDEKIETLQQCMMQLQTLGPNANPMCQAILADYQQGEQWKDSVAKIGKIIKIIVQYMFDTQVPGFKMQMKQLVRRVKTNSVGYIRIKYQDSFEPSMTTSETQSTIVGRLRKVADLLKKYSDDKTSETSKDFETLQSLALSIGQSMTSGDVGNIQEQITFDFPPSDSIIVDPCCRQLKGFVNANWVVQEYCPPLDYVNEFFELTGSKRELSSLSLTKLYHNHGAEGKPQEFDFPAKDGEDQRKPHCKLYEVFDLNTKSTFFIVEGAKFFIQPPEAVEPETGSFWPIKALTFNDIECEPDAYDAGDSTLFPPSDVDLLRSVQREYNRTRESWRWQRIANAPKYMTGKGWLSDNDKDAISDSEENSIVELEGAPIGTDIGKMLAPFRFAPFDQALYDTNPLMQDLLQSTGMLQENLGSQSSKGTATGQTIAEQSRVSGLSSNVDDLDELLSCVARDCGEIILRRFRKETVVRIAGRGAMLAWPDDPNIKEDFINELFLDTVAASSGRPNKALETSNFERLAPIMANAGANPIGLIEWGVSVMDADVDISKFFPIVPPAMGGGPPAQAQAQPGQPAKPGQATNNRQQQQGQQRAQAKPQQPLQRNPQHQQTAAPVPMAAS